MRRGYAIFCWEPWLSCNFTSYQETVEVVYTQYLFEFVIPDLKSRHGLRKRKRRALSSTLEEKKLINKKYISDFSNNIDTTRELFYILAVHVGRSCSGGITGRGKVLGKSVKVRVSVHLPLPDLPVSLYQYRLTQWPTEAPGGYPKEMNLHFPDGH